MKQRLLSVFAMLSLMISGVMAQTFTISTDCEGYFIAGDRVEVSINVEGAQEMTALQFNFSLPEGFTLSEGWPIYMGNATNGHAMNASILDSGDLFVVLYSLHSGTFDDGTLISFNVTAAEDAVSTQGKLYNVRTATTDAVSHTLSDVTFAMNIASEEPEPTWHLSGPATEEEITTQSYIDGLVYNQTTKPRTITLKKGYNMIIIPSSWTTPTFGLVSDFSKRYTPFTANDLGITNPSNKNVLVLWSEVENATCYVKWGTNVVPEPEPDILVSNISLDQTATTLVEGETLTLKATVSPDDATDKTVTWSTSDAAIATVADGVVTAVAAGTATITATAGDYSATCVVTVESNVVDGIDNSEIINHKSEIIYDLTGRRVTHPAKGVYIVNGKKVVIK